ncbi:HNH endonuclease [Enhygromyxa salina]|uniref:HNH endonuclease n=1 Tax=Enhygromyxa salina TaxID=215803 RepID=UPI002690A6CC
MGTPQPHRAPSCRLAGLGQLRSSQRCRVTVGAAPAARQDPPLRQDRQPTGDRLLHDRRGASLAARSLDPQPSDWRPRTVVGATYDLTKSEGRRVWLEARRRGSAEVLSTFAGEPAIRYGKPVLTRPRQGQGIFRVSVLETYERACGATNERSLPVLDTAHIRPLADGGAHDLDNGLALRVDLHRLFDRGYVTFDRERRLVVSRRLHEEFDNGKTYYEMEGRPLREPTEQTPTSRSREIETTSSSGESRPVQGADPRPPDSARQLPEHRCCGCAASLLQRPHRPGTARTHAERRTPVIPTGCVPSPRHHYGSSHPVGDPSSPWCNASRHLAWPFRRGQCCRNLQYALHEKAGLCQENVDFF